MPTPKYIPESTSPRFFVAGSIGTLLVWAFRMPQGKNEFTYYYVDTSGTIHALGYSVVVARTGNKLRLALSQGKARCRTIALHLKRMGDCCG